MRCHRLLLSVCALLATQVWAEEPPLEARIELLRDEVRVGDPVLLGLSIANVGEEPVLLANPAGRRSWSLEIVGPNGVVEGPKQCPSNVIACSFGWPSLEIVELPPGQSLGHVISLAESYEVWDLGRYQIRAVHDSEWAAHHASRFDEGVPLTPPPDDWCIYQARQFWNRDLEVTYSEPPDSAWSEPLATAWASFDVGEAFPEERDALQSLLGAEPKQLCWREGIPAGDGITADWLARHGNVDFAVYACARRSRRGCAAVREAHLDSPWAAWNQLRRIDNLLDCFDVGEATLHLTEGLVTHPVWGPAARWRVRQRDWILANAVALQLEPDNLMTEAEYDAWLEAGGEP